MEKAGTYPTREKEREKIRVIVNGLGSLGSLGVRIMATKKAIEIVGAVARRKEKAGRDLGEVIGLGRKLGVIVSNDADAVFSETVADIVVDATYSTTKELYPVLTKALKAKLNLVSIGEELSYPWVNAAELALSIDKLAKKNGVTVMGTGVNPGLACDAIPIFLSGALANLKKIRMRRVADISPYVGSQTIMTHFGMGLTPEEYQKKVEEGIVVGHWGSPESLAVIADTLGWPVKMEQIKEPLIAETHLDISGKRIEPGQVYGSKQVDRALMDGEEVIAIELILALKPEAGGAEPGMWYRLEGDPNIELKFVSGITGPEEIAKVTIARAINAIPYVVRAKPGLLSVNEVGVISYLS